MGELVVIRRAPLAVPLAALVVALAAACEPTETPRRPREPQAAADPRADPAGRVLGPIRAVGERGLRMLVPPGFEPARGRVGFEDPRTGDAILYDVDDVPYEERLERYDRSRLAEQKIALEDLEEGEQDGLPATFLHMTLIYQNRSWERWEVAFGDAAGSVSVSGTCLKDRVREAGPLLRAVVESARWDRGPDADPFAGVGFRLDPPAGFEPVRRTPSLVELRLPTGETPPAEPHLWIERRSESEGDAAARDPAALARGRLLEVGWLRAIEPGQPRPAAIDGLRGFELSAEAVSKLDGERVVAHLLVLFGDGQRWLTLGLASARYRDGAFEEMTAAARTFRREELDLHVAPE